MGAGRKQAIHRRELNSRRNAARAAFKARYPNGYRSAPAARRPANPLVSALGVTLAVAVMVLIAAFLLHNQIEIARVMAGGRPAQATIVAVRCQNGSRSSTGDVTVTFTDLHGQRQTVAHTSDDTGCYSGYAAGDIITIRYVPDDPTALLTQQEIDDIWWEVALYALVDGVFLVAPVVIAGWLAWRKGAPWLRRRWAAGRAPIPSGQAPVGSPRPPSP